MVTKKVDGNNLLSLYDSLTASELGISNAERTQIRARLSRQGVTSYKDRNKVLGFSKGSLIRNKIEKAHYDWLFDDLQRFTSKNSDDIRSKQDLLDFIDDTLGKSPSFKKSSPIKRDRATSKIVNSWISQDLVSTRDSDDVANRLTSREVTGASEKSGLTDKQRIILRAKATSGDAWLLEGKQAVVKKIDRRGREIFQNLKTGRFAPNPIKKLKKAGF